MPMKFNPDDMGLEVSDDEYGTRIRDLKEKKKKDRTNFEMVRDFHIKFGHPARHEYHDPDAEEVTLRIRLIAEEFAELIAAMQLNLSLGDRGPNSDEHFELVADSLADLLYVVYGTALNYGLPMDEIFYEVHRSNMTKTSVKDEGGKITKGEKFRSPDLGKVLWET